MMRRDAFIAGPFVVMIAVTSMIWASQMIVLEATRFSSTRDQYESYPYPPERPERSRRPGVVLQSPSHLIEMNHHIWGGRRNFCDEKEPFRILVAGGGTGEKTLQLARQIADMNAMASIVHLDISEASIAIAKRRAETLGLEQHVRFVRGSILNVKSLDIGPFHCTCDHTVSTDASRHSQVALFFAFVQTSIVSVFFTT